MIEFIIHWILNVLLDIGTYSMTYWRPDPNVTYY